MVVWALVGLVFEKNFSMDASAIRLFAISMVSFMAAGTVSLIRLANLKKRSVESLYPGRFLSEIKLLAGLVTGTQAMSLASLFNMIGCLVGFNPIISLAIGGSVGLAFSVADFACSYKKFKGIEDRILKAKPEGRQGGERST